MFTNTLDNKPQIVDQNGNTIVDLTRSIFRKNASPVLQYQVKRMNSHVIMRPDIVALAEYETTEMAEYILKYSGISNPFTLAEDDLLMIPNEDEAKSQMTDHKDDTDKDKKQQSQTAAIRNYFKFVNQDYKKDSTSYDRLANTEIKSAVVSNGTLKGDYYVPYIATDDTTSIIIKNGRVFFGEESINDPENFSTTDMDKKIQAIIDSTATALSDSNCMYNGATLADFVRATMKSNGSSNNT